MNSQSNMENLYREAGRVSFQEITGCYIPMPAVVQEVAEWQGAREKPNNQLDKVDLDKSQHDPPVSFGTKYFQDYLVFILVRCLHQHPG